MNDLKLETLEDKNFKNTCIFLPELIIKLIFFFFLIYKMAYYLK